MYTFTQIKISNMYHAKWSADVSMAICWNWCFFGILHPINIVPMDGGKQYYIGGKTILMML